MQALIGAMELPAEIAEDLMASWEDQQNCHIRFREDRFRIMFDLVDEAFGTSVDAIDLACGPGSLSRRLLGRMPDSRVTAVDYDPVLLSLGKQALRELSENINWVEGDLKEDTWMEGLNSGSYDCAMSTTALHWLDSASLEHLYGNVYRMLRKGGIFMNGDHMV